MQPQSRREAIGSMSGSPPHPTEIRRGLEEIRIRWRLFWFLAGGLLLTFALFSVWALRTSQWEERASTYLSGLLFSSIIVNIAWLRIVASRCPRCGHRFYVGGGMPASLSWRVFGRRCVHCRLDLHSTGHTGDDAH